MGSHPYWYVVPFDIDIDAALQSLRQREFKAGRYNPVIRFPKFPVDANSPSPGNQHNTYVEAFEAAETDGTRSIIDLHFVSKSPEGLGERPDLTVWPLSKEQLLKLFGTTEPKAQAVLDSRPFWDDIGRGSGRYVVLHQNGRPHEIFFAGMSID